MNSVTKERRMHIEFKAMQWKKHIFILQNAQMSLRCYDNVYFLQITLRKLNE